MRYGRTAHDSQVLSNYRERTVQNEAIQSFRTIGTEPSHSTQSNLRGSVSVNNDESSILQYIYNSRRRTGRGRGEIHASLPRDNDETPAPGKNDFRIQDNILLLRDFEEYNCGNYF